MIKDIRDFEGLDRHIKCSQHGLIRAVIEYYSNLGKRQGYTVRENATVISHGVNLGKIDLVWIEPDIVFVLEFNSVDNFLKNLWKIVEMNPELVVIVLSSKSNCKPGDVVKLIKNSEITKDIKENFMILDIGKKEVIEFVE